MRCFPQVDCGGGNALAEQLLHDALSERWRIAISSHCEAWAPMFPNRMQVYCQDEPMELTTRRAILERLNLRLCDFKRWKRVEGHSLLKTNA